MTQSDLVIQWNDVLHDAIRAAGTPPPVAARAMATLHTAMFDAMNGAEGSPYEAYHVSAGSALAVSGEAAAIAAAHTVLNALFPNQQTLIQNVYTHTMATVTDSRFLKEAGQAWGEQVGEQILALRAHDGATAVVTPSIPDGIGMWEKTPPAFANPLLPQWPSVTPWTMRSGDQFRPSAPPAVTSEEYTAAFNETKSLGEKHSVTRTADQTQIAHFWADGPGTQTPPGHVQDIAKEIANIEHNSVLENARLFALLSTAVADAGIVAWDAKYAYWDWRPVTAIAQADGDGNPQTAAQAGWEPLLATPPFPDYISGHSTFSGAGAKMIELFFGRDNYYFDVQCDELPGVTRHFTSVWDAAEEAGRSRIFGGIHWEFSNQKGLESGAALSRYIYDHFMRTQKLLPTGSDHYDASSQTVQLIRAGEGHDVVSANSLNNEVNGNQGNDTLSGQAGQDTLLGGKGSDLVYGNAGDDVLLGNLGDDTLQGNTDQDTLTGGDGRDLLRGGQGYDVLDGGSGDDVLFGDKHHDVLTGGAGADQFVFSDASGHDRITDFAPLEDMLYLKPGINGIALDSVDDLAARATAVAGGLQLDLGGDHLLTLDGVALADLGTHNVWFIAT